jgi:hypothetical protein
MPTTMAAALQAERVAVLYRRIVLLVGGQMLAGCFGQVMAGGADAGGAGALLAMVGLLVLVGALVFGVMCAIATFQLMRELGSPVPWLWGVAIFVPCVSIIVLLVLSSRAQAWCKERGIEVGLLGPTKESIDRLKRESSVDRIFE